MARSFAIAVLAALCVPLTVLAAIDTDTDGIEDTFDNCTTIANAEQLDSDCDGFGNRCDADLNNSNGTVNFADLAAFRAVFGSSAAPGEPGAKADLNASGGTVNFADLAVFRTLFGNAVGPTGLPQPFSCSPPTPVAVTLLSSSPQLPSDATGAGTVTLTAFVRGANQAPLAGVPVSFSIASGSSGSLVVTQPTTDVTGRAIARLSNALSPVNRPITVSASVGALNTQATIDVVGMRLTLTGPATVSRAQATNYVARLTDSRGVGISGATVAFTTSTGMVVTPESATTSATGTASLSVVGTTAGARTLTASTPGYATTVPITVDLGDFRLEAPVANVEIPLATSRNVQALWTKNFLPQAGELINFTTTRGSLSAATAVTNGSGRATTTISSATTGLARITATNDEGTVVAVNVEFVAVTPASIDAATSPFVVNTGGTSEVSAVVRDATGNPVKNRTVQFVLTDPTGGALASGTAVTNRHGRAITQYSAGSIASAANGVQVQASVTGTTPLIQDGVSMTVTQPPILVDIATTGDVIHLSPATYAKEWSFLVTDSAGNPVANRALQATIASTRYHKGSMAVMPGANLGELAWLPAYAERDGVGAGDVGCSDEDLNRDGILSANEDDPIGGTGFGNGSGSMEAGNIAVLTALPSNAPSGACSTVSPGGSVSVVLTTNAHGRARACLVHPRDYNGWVNVELSARTSVAGTEYETQQPFKLEGSRADWDDETTPATGAASPFGTASSCRQPN